MKHGIKQSIILVFIIALAVGIAQAQKSLPDTLGVTHASPKYYFGVKDSLNEGADRLLNLGTRVIKVWFVRPQNSYTWNSNWPAMKTLVDQAKAPYFIELFGKPFTTFILETYSIGRGDHYFINGITEAQKLDEQRQFYELTAHLLKTYAGSGKTFILQHWEGDWAIRGNFDANSDPTPAAISGMIQWLNARQAGVDQARKEFSRKGVKVYHAAEVNHVVKSMKLNRTNVVNSVLPHTNCDMVSYSCYDAIVGANIGKPQVLRDALDYLAKHMPDSPEFGDKNVYLGEYGIPSNQYPAESIKTLVTDTTQTALNWGCQYLVYWQLYCNENKSGTFPPITDNADVRGFWLVKPDGTKTWQWNYFNNLLKGSQ